MRRGAWLWAVALAAVAPEARASDDASIGTALAAALPADGSSDLLFIQRPSAGRAPRVVGVTRSAAVPATIRAVLREPARYSALIPALHGTPVVEWGALTPFVDWELDVPLFNLSGRIALRDSANGVTFDLVDGDLAPGRIVFSIVQDPGGGSTLIVDAQLNVKRSSWLLRHIMTRSPVGESAVLAAAAYVALRATALRAEHPAAPSAWRPTAPPGSARLADARPLAAQSLSALRGQGTLALVAREKTERLGGVAVGIGLRAPQALVLPALRDPASWRAFPGWRTVRVRPGPNGPGAEVEDNLPLVDLDATWTADPEPAGAAPRWTVSAGATVGARLGWSLYPVAGVLPTLAVLTLYPRLEATGMVARRFIQAEPLLEEGLALALAYVNATGIQAFLDPPR
jgi:hypothetical protein